MSTYLHPGVYIKEIPPAAPIAGVGTSTAAFIGVAAMGDTDPTRITSWDAFIETYGAPLNESYADGAYTGISPRAWLAGSVKAFFENGGTACWIVRASSGTFATAELNTRNAPNDAVIVAQARPEGAAGNGLTLTVSDRNPINDAYGADLKVHRKQTSVTAQAADNRSVTVAAVDGFEVGDLVMLDDGGGTTIDVLVDAVLGLTTIGFAQPLAGNFAGGTMRIADLAAGVRRIRVDVPPGESLRRTIAAGSTVIVDAGATQEFRVVTDVGIDSITLRDALDAAHPLTADVDIAGAAFDLAIAGAPGVSETLSGLEMDASHPKWFGSAQSELVRLDPPAAPPGGTITDPRPQAQATAVTPAANDDRAAAWQALESDPSPQLRALAPIDEVAIVAIPGAVDPLAHDAIITHCESLGDRVAILDPPPGQTPQQVATLAPSLTGGDRGFASLYYPWLRVLDPATKKLAFWPPSAHMAGIFARTDAERGVHKAPANVTVRGAIGVERRLTDADQDLLNPAGVNAFRLPAAGGPPRVWGARTTTTSLNAAWQYINIRRLFNWIEESIAEGIRWAVFEPNDKALWAKLDRTITAFLTQAQRDGAIFGAKPAEGFYVRIDEALNPPSQRALGRLYLEIGVMPVYPAEFIVVRIGIWDGGSEANES